jgi:hypothetical protein
MHIGRKTQSTLIAIESFDQLSITESMELLLEKLSKARTNGDFLGSLSGG